MSDPYRQNAAPVDSPPSRGVRLARFVVEHGFYFGWLAAGIGMSIHDAWGLAAMIPAATAMGVAWGCAKEAATRP